MVKDVPLPDEELVSEFRGPDGVGPSSAQEADRLWSLFLGAFEGRIRYTCRYWMNRYGRPDEAEDRYQDVIALLCKDNYRPIREFVPGRAKMSTWVSAVATNTCRGWFRTRDRTVWAPEPKGEPDAGPRELVDDDSSSAFDLISDDEAGHAMVRALAECSTQLDDKRLLVFVARLLLQLAHDRKVTITEVGRLFGDSPQKTKYRLDTTLQLLRDCVAGKLTEEGSR